MSTPSAPSAPDTFNVDEAMRRITNSATQTVTDASNSAAQTVKNAAEYATALIQSYSPAEHTPSSPTTKIDPVPVTPFIPASSPLTQSAPLVSALTDGERTTALEETRAKIKAADAKRMEAEERDRKHGNMIAIAVGICAFIAGIIILSLNSNSKDPSTTLTALGVILIVFPILCFLSGGED